MVPMTTFHYERPWDRIYQKRVLRTKLNICVNVYIFNCHIVGLVWFMVFNTTFNNSSVILWWSVLLFEETGVHGENHRTVASHQQSLSHNVESSTPRNERGSNSQP